MRLAVVQARMGSTRFPGKVLQKIGNLTILEIICMRIKKASSIDKLVVATSANFKDDLIEKACNEMGVDVFRGSETDVLDRFFQVCLKYHAQDVLRVTADCPLVDPSLIDQLFDFYTLGNFDHAGIATGAGVSESKLFKFPDGLDSEWFTFKSLERAIASSTSSLDREHVTPYIWNNKDLFAIGILESEIDYSDIRLTLDTPLDLVTFNEAYKQFGDNLYSMSFKIVVDWIRKLPYLPSSFGLIGHENYGVFHNGTI